MIGEVLSTIREFHMINEGDNIVIGLSGGADSVCLFLNLLEYRQMLPFNITAVHIDHGIRQESDKDVSFVEGLTSEKNVPLKVFPMDIPTRAKRNHQSLEEAGREARYEKFNEVLTELGGRGAIAVAQHADDLAETMIHNLCRGSSIKGLEGIKAVSGNVIRPLIRTRRSEIEAYLLAANRSFCVDATNFSNDYTRNRIRNEILPAMVEKINPSAVNHMVALSEDIREVEGLLDLLTKDALSQCALPGGEEYSVRAIAGLHPAIAKRLLHIMAGRAAGGNKDIQRSHIEALYRLCNDTKGAKSIDLPRGGRISRIYDKLVINCGLSSPHENDDLCRGGKWNLEEERVSPPEFSIIKTEGINIEDIPRGKYTKWFDYDKINSRALWRTRQEGDYLMIRQRGELHRKSLSDYMTDEKISGRERDQVWLLADGSHIMWVMGGRCSDYYMLDADSRTILEVSIDGLRSRHER